MTEFDLNTDTLTINIDGQHDLYTAQQPNYSEAVSAFEDALESRIKEIAAARGIDVRVVRFRCGSPEALECDGDVGAAPGTADYLAADLWQSAHDDLASWTAPAKQADAVVDMLVDEGWDVDDVTAAVERQITTCPSLPHRPKSGEKMLTSTEIQEIIWRLN